VDALLFRVVLMNPKERSKCKLSYIVQGMLLDLDTVLKEIMTTTDDQNALKTDYSRSWTNMYFIVSSFYS